MESGDFLKEENQKLREGFPALATLFTPTRKAQAGNRRHGVGQVRGGMDGALPQD